MAVELNATEHKPKYMLLESSKEIWEMVRKTYSKVQDASVIYQIKTRMASTKQDNLTVTE